MAGFRSSEFRPRNRLSGTDFVATLKSGRALRSREFSLLKRANPAGPARLGIVVPKRILGRAVDRNRCKRLVREWFRQSQEELAGFDWVFRLHRRPDRLGAGLVEAIRTTAAPGTR